MRRKIGILLLILAVLAVLSAAAGIRKGTGTRFIASGKNGFFAPPRMPDGIIRINEADTEELTVLPGVGETLAAEILREKDKNGPFHYPEDLLSVRGIGAKKLKGIWSWLDLGGE